MGQDLALVTTVSPISLLKVPFQNLNSYLIPSDETPWIPPVILHEESSERAFWEVSHNAGGAGCPPWAFFLPLEKL